MSSIDGKEYSAHVQAIFYVKDGMTDAFLNFLDEEDGLPYTVTNEGCRCYHASKGKNDEGEYVVLSGFWENKDLQEAYMATEKRAGTYPWMEKMGDYLRSPPILLLAEAVKQYYSPQAATKKPARKTTAVKTTAVKTTTKKTTSKKTK